MRSSLKIFCRLGSRYSVQDSDISEEHEQDPYILEVQVQVLHIFEDQVHII